MAVGEGKPGIRHAEMGVPRTDQQHEGHFSPMIRSSALALSKQISSD
jgi:hypothetical protein